MVRKILKEDIKEKINEIKPITGKDGITMSDYCNIKYEVRLSTTLEDIIIEASDL